MAQPEFSKPSFMDGTTAEEIQQRMMKNLPADIDNMPGGFPYDFTMPSALELSENINWYMVRALMIAFPEYAWDEWLDLHGQQVHITRRAAQSAEGVLKVSGEAGTIILAGTQFCTESNNGQPSIIFEAKEQYVISEEGFVDVTVKAVETGESGNVGANTIKLMVEPDKAITEVVNLEATSGGTEIEDDDSYYDRIAVEYANSKTFLGSDTDYIRWAKEAGAGDCIVVPAANGPGTVKLILTDPNGTPANAALIKAVYDYIVSPNDRAQRLLPTACAELTCAAAVNVTVDFAATGLVVGTDTNIDQIVADFKTKMASVFSDAKKNNVLRYNDARPILSLIDGVEDFATFTMNGEEKNITFAAEEYPLIGKVEFS